MSSSAAALSPFCLGLKENGQNCNCRVTQQVLDKAFESSKKELYFDGILCKCGHNVACHASTPSPGKFVSHLSLVLCSFSLVFSSSSVH